PVRSSPPTLMAPVSGGRPPLMMLTSVDLPAPLWPTSPTHSPAATSKSTPPSARTAPKLFSAPFTAKTTAFCAVVLMCLDEDLLRVGDGLLSVFQRVLDIGHAARGGVFERFLQVILVDLDQRHHELLRHIGAVKNLLRHPEGQRRHARRDGDRIGLVAIGVLLLLPPPQLVLAVTHDDGGHVATGGVEGLCRAVAVTTLGDDADDVLGQAGQNAGDRLLSHILGPVAVHRSDHLELAVGLEAFLDA